jgi:hypothetical protein
VLINKLVVLDVAVPRLLLPRLHRISGAILFRKGSGQKKSSP